MYNVAIACQGGGSHTAFTAGVLQELLPWIEDSEDCRLVGMSGTSGGAVSALAGWYGYLSGGSEGAVETLEELWADVVADTPVERLVNQWAVWGIRLQTTSVPVPSVSPYHLPFSDLGKREFVRTLERHVEFDRLSALVGPETPRLVVGTVDINAGEFETFTDADVTPEAVLASAAVPTLFEAVEIDGHYHWDGLFSQNPPVYDLMHVPPERKPDELWVVQINPQTRETEPRTIEEIVDRRNELSGNLSVNQELRFIESVNDMLARGHLPEDQYTHTEIRRLGLTTSLGYHSKLDRDPAFVGDLLSEGRETAGEFLDHIEVGEHEHDVWTERTYD